MDLRDVWDVLFALKTLKHWFWLKISLGKSDIKKSRAIVVLLSGDISKETLSLVQNHQTESSVAFWMPILENIFRAVFSTVCTEISSLSATSFLEAPQASNSATSVSLLASEMSVLIAMEVFPALPKYPSLHALRISFLLPVPC